MNKKPIALGAFVSDLHFSEVAPIARSAEEDWLGVQEGYVRQLKVLAIKFKVPIFIAGDLLDKWNSSPYLINKVIQWFAGMEIWAVPGNHDTPNHNLSELERSAYKTLIEAKIINNIGLGLRHEIELHSFAFSEEVTPLKKAYCLGLDIALIHSYIWTKNTGHKDASPENRYNPWLKKLKGYDVAFFGDNHQPFLIKGGPNKPWVCNCGTFIRRRSDERDLKPSVWLLMSDNSIQRHLLDTSKDKWLDLPEGAIKELEASLEMDLQEFAEELDSLHTEKRNFNTIVLRWIKKNKVKGIVKDALLRAIGK